MPELLRELIEQVRKEWDVVISAPFTFLLIVIIAGGIGYYAASWRYSAIQDVLNERIKGKDDQLAEYRERLHLVPAKGNEFSLLTDAELKTRDLRFVSDLRKWLGDTQEQDDRIIHQQFAQMANEKNTDKKRQIFGEISARLPQHMREYDKKFKVAAVIIHDEILSRLPPETASPVAFGFVDYEFPTNFIGVALVADNLEWLAKLLT